MRVFRLWILLSMAALAGLQAGCVSTAPRAPGRFVERSVASDGRTHRYQVFVPAVRDASGKAPMIVQRNGQPKRAVRVRMADHGASPSRAQRGTCRALRHRSR